MKTLLIILLIVAAVGFLALQQSEINRKCESRRKYADLWDFYHMIGTCKVNDANRSYIFERLSDERLMQRDEKALHIVEMCEDVFNARFNSLKK